MTPDLWRMGLLVFLGVLLFAVPQAALLPLLDRDEPRFAEASREMLQSGNYIVPTFNHNPRYAKPPLIYWCQAFSFKIFGEDAFAARLPSLMATAGTALLLFIWGVQLGDKNIGLIAAFSYGFCLQTVQQGRVATADALLILFMTLTAFAGWHLVSMAHQKSPIAAPARWNRWGAILVVGFAGGFLSKGPEALLLIIPIVICARSCGKRVLFSFAAMLLLGLLIVAMWAVPAFIMTHGDYWRMGLSEGVGQRMVSGMQGHGASSFGGYLLSLPYYLILFWISALPWSPLLVIWWRTLFSTWKSNALDTYLLINIGLIFVVFSLMVTKLPHYTLPAFPFVALFFARRWIVAGLSPKLPIKLTVGFGIGFALFAVVSIPAAMANHASPSPVGELVREAEFMPSFKTEQVPFPHPTGRLVTIPPGMLTADTKFALVDFQEPSVIWEMRHVVNDGKPIGFGETIPEAQAIPFLSLPGPRAILLSTTLWHQLDVASSPTTRSWKIYEARGFNAAKGSFIDLTLVVKN